MKSLLVFLISSFCLLMFNQAGAQQHYKKRVYDLSPMDVIEGDTVEPDYNCALRYHYPLAERLNIYPFNKAIKVEIISFKTPGSVLLNADSADLYYPNFDLEYTSLPVKKNSSAGGRIIESIVLNKDQLDSLTSILYNYDYTKISRFPQVNSMSGCYAPHNGLLFYNTKGQIFAFIELCFACEGLRISDKKVDSGVPCWGKFALLKQFFKANGITIGTDKIPMVEMPDIQLKK